MAYPSTPRLDNLAAMQSRPMGTNTALYRDPSTEALTRQYRQQKSDYGLARRLLTRAARRGDVNAALKTIDLGKAAQAQGVQFGMEGRDQQAAAVNRQRSTMEKGVTGMGLAAGRLRGDATPAPAGGTPAPAGGTPVEMAGPPSSASMNSLPTTGLGTQADQAMREKGGSDIGFRKGLNRALFTAKTPDEMNDLRRTATQAGISQQQFDAAKDKAQKSTALNRLLVTGRARK